MPRFKVGDKLFDPRNDNTRDVIEVSDSTYLVLVTTPDIRGVTGRFDRVSFYDIEKRFELCCTPTEKFVRAKLKSMGYGL